jgi:RimJ/RimL family protein N-acetyltransferase
MAPNVSLRVAASEDVEWMVQMSSDREAVGEHNWSGSFDPDARRASLLTELTGDQTSVDEGRRIVVLDERHPIGDVSWRTERWGPSAKSTCPSIGVALLPEHRGCGYGTQAQRLLVDFLFTTFDVHRVQSDTAIDNPAEQRALEKVGFVREGIVRDAEFRNDQYYDHILYSILRSEWKRWS